MKNSEDAMEKVLAGLRGVEAPDGMERRILRALEDRAETKSESGLSWLRPMWLERQMIGRALVCGVALAGVVAVGLAISAFRRMERAPVQSKADSPSTGVRPSAESASPIATVAPSQGGVQAARKRGVTVVARTSNGEVEAATDDDSVAMSEMRAASHPAPPMPLTEQERLLLRIVHKDDPVQMAVLNPVLRAAKDAEDQAEFQSFFGVGVERTAADLPKAEQTTDQPKTEEPTRVQLTTEPSTTGDTNERN